MHEIKLLPEHIVNQIKAGEVVESPATLLKELIENSIDAESTRIEVTVSDDLTSHIIVKDNGYGINKKNLPLAFTRHATSKIHRFNDIYNLHSFGFRGEALASIASISDISCRTTNLGNTTTMEMQAGNILSLEEHKSNEPQGTEFHVKNIFHNTPARLKFIRSKNTEKNKLKKIIEVFVISNPQITFIINLGEKDKKFYPSIIEENSTQKRVIQLINTSKKKLKTEDLLSKSFSYQGHHILFIANKTSSKGVSNKRQYLVANNRYFIDKKIHHLIIRKMAETFWPPGQSGDYFCLFNVPAEMMDPNVHPSKTEIKFIHHEYLLSGLSSIIKSEKPIIDKDEKNTVEQKVTREENPRNFQIENTYFYKLEANQHGSQTLNFFDQFIIKKNQNELVTIYHTRQILKSFINHFLSFANDFCQSNNTLLIGITFDESEIKGFSPEIEHKYNLHLERIKDSTWILKEIPEILDFLPTRLAKDILLLLINQDETDKNRINDLIKNHSGNLTISNINQIETIIKTKEFSRNITVKHLESLFNQLT